MLATKSSTAEKLHVRATGAQRQTLPSASPQRHPAQTQHAWTRRDKLTVGVSFAVCVAVLWFLAAQAAAMWRLNDQVSQLQRQIRTAQAQNVQLTTQVDQLSQPSRILDIALNKLHMRYAQPISISQESRP
ncbi:MAG: septum formation initiator family protein [Thermoflavifilum sp.]|nr:septum formation initiator family protein [Thermoflavifilum sp.]MCL6513261.1 septum formation initiator family protein [Alicyclobacillus sp.]